MATHIRMNMICKTFKSHVVLDNIQLQIEKGEFLCLLGPSGCGKTTLLRILSGLELADSGNICIHEKDVTNIPAGDRNFGMVFQSYALFPNLTAYENVAYGLRNKKMKEVEIAQIVNELFDMMHLTDRRTHYPSQLSGGEQQRVALARALAMKPDFLLLDEPLSALDAKVRIKLRNEIRNIQKKLGITTIMVTHDQEEALAIADRVVVMDKAQIQQIGTPQEVFERPQNTFVAEFVGTMNYLKGIREYKENEERVYGIRPSYIRVVHEKEEHAIEGCVQHIEFHGIFYRLSVSYQGYDSMCTLIVDVALHQYYTMQFQKGNIVYMKLLDDKILVFDKYA